jgi:hypothetical protein
MPIEVTRQRPLRLILISILPRLRLYICMQKKEVCIRKLTRLVEAESSTKHDDTEKQSKTHVGFRTPADSVVSPLRL